MDGDGVVRDWSDVPREWGEALRAFEEQVARLPGVLLMPSRNPGGLSGYDAARERIRSLIMDPPDPGVEGARRLEESDRSGVTTAERDAALPVAQRLALIDRLLVDLDWYGERRLRHPVLATRIRIRAIVASLGVELTELRSSVEGTPERIRRDGELVDGLARELALATFTGCARGRGIRTDPANDELFWAGADQSGFIAAAHAILGGLGLLGPGV